jgi:trans-aconitate methyltransferase
MRFFEKYNKECYDALAGEYDGDSHETLRDFDECTRSFVKFFVQNCLGTNKQKYSMADVGTGTGFAVCQMQKNVEIDSVLLVDISKKMLDIAKNKIVSCDVKVKNMTADEWTGDDKYDIVTAIMADPYISRNALHVLASHVDRGGYILVTYPNIKWACQTRDELMIAKFNTLSNGRQYSFSFCLSEGTFRELVFSAGLDIVVHITYQVIKGEKMSKLNENLVKRLGVKSYPFCECYVLKRA